MLTAMPAGPDTPKDPGTFMLALGRPWITAAELRPIVRGLNPVNLALLAREASHAIDQGLMGAREELRPIGHLDSAALAWVEDVAAAADRLIEVFARSPLLGVEHQERRTLSRAWTASERLSEVLDPRLIEAYRRGAPRLDLGPRPNWAHAVQALAEFSRQVVEERRPRLRSSRPTRAANKMLGALLVGAFNSRWRRQTKRAAAFPLQVFDLARPKIEAALHDGADLVAVLRPPTRASATLARKGVQTAPLVGKCTTPRGRLKRL
jgi:hypothetical protein